LEQIKHLHHIAARAARDEKIKENTDHQKSKNASPSQIDTLHTEENSPAHAGDELDGAAEGEAD
ncbi:MAG TPA: hypothetical protein VFD27_22425, partial [Chthoniobacteraceae bacterium]|nr:hypothetical protein [Chthoniobacteraceae bacterium]